MYRVKNMGKLTKNVSTSVIRLSNQNSLLDCISFRFNFIAWRLLTCCLLSSFIHNLTLAQTNSTLAGNGTSVEDALPSTSQPSVLASIFKSSCQDGTCTIQFESTEEVVDKVIAYTEAMFMEHANGSEMGYDGMKDFMIRIGLLTPDPPAEDDHSSHDHSSHSSESSDYWDSLFAEIDDDNIANTTQCLKSESDVFYEHNGLQSDVIDITEFWLLLPRFLFDLHSKDCHDSTEDAHPEHGNKPGKENRVKVWGFAILSVAVISVLSIIGILIVPLMRHSVQFNRLLSFLIALAVGTLIGDALLHLLPHAMGNADHSGHDHSSEAGVAEERQKVMKSLVAVWGIYMFFIFESGMTIMRQRKRQKKHANEKAALPTSGVITASPTKSVNGFATTPDVQDLLLNAKESHLGNGDAVINCNHSNGANCLHVHDTKQLAEQYGQNGTRTNHVHPAGTNNVKSCHGDTTAVVIENSHGHHHYHDHHHHHGNLADAKGIKDMAWMIVMGDGLHNFSDGLAIGAAFSSSIAAGLSTSLAVFCHELPHELGDFAILLNAGMSIKQAILYNGLCACLAFIGVVIGLAIGEYTTSVKLWILAITAGGFLYVALVDMLPQMLRSIIEKDGLFRFIFQNIGFVLGVVIMLIIALYESSFQAVFGAGHAHF